MYLHVIPGFVLWRPAQGNLLVPFFSAAEFGINIDNDAAIVKFIVMNQLTDKEMWLGMHGNGQVEWISLPPMMV
jgi:hypothetical protein